MKLLARFNNRRGLAMTEYLIILAIVAIAAIAVVGLFGKQIKAVFVRSTGALAGKQVENKNDDKLEDKIKQVDMGSFDQDVTAPQKQ